MISYSSRKSVYSLIENNETYGNYVIYQSNFIMIKDSVGYFARASNVRINQVTVNNFVIGALSGGSRGIYLYGKTQNTLIKDYISKT
jgi:hypothetical protein